MISVKIASIIAIAAFAAGSLFAPPVQQAIAAVIATDVQCTGCVGTTDVAGNAITGVKIKDGEVKAAEIATDAVGAAEIQGVTKLLFGQCATDSIEGNTNVTSGAGLLVKCSISGVDADDSAIAELSAPLKCFEVRAATPVTNAVNVIVGFDCPGGAKIGTGTPISVIVYDK